MPIEKAKFIWMDGKLVPWDEAKIHILSHVIHYGTGVFEGLRCYKTKKGPAIFRLKDHHRKVIQFGEDLSDGNPLHPRGD